MAYFKVYITPEFMPEICETAKTLAKAKSIANKYKRDTYVIDLCITDEHGNVLVHYDRIDSGYGKPKWCQWNTTIERV